MMIRRNRNRNSLPGGDIWAAAEGDYDRGGVHDRFAQDVRSEYAIAEEVYILLGYRRGTHDQGQQV